MDLLTYTKIRLKGKLQLEETGVIDDAFKKRLNTQIHKINWIDTDLLKKKKKKT